MFSAVVKFNRISFIFLSVFFLSAIVASDIAEAQSLIRDTEIEDTIAEFSKPIFDAAGVSADSVEIYLVNDRRLNAFVAGGQKLFLHTGLIQRSETPEQLIGVIAHETGHIAGGHLVRLRQKLEGFSPESILGYVLGGAAIAAGQAGLGGALITGGQDLAQRSLLSYTRSEEGSADQAAVSYLNQAGISPAGLLEFFEILKEQQITTTSEQNPYIRSHPLTLERVSFIRDQLSISPAINATVSSEWIEKHARMKAKIDGYFLNFKHVMRLYPEIDQSIPARFARSYAYFQNSQFDKALEEVNKMIEERSEDPYFYEFKGQVLFEAGRLEESIVALEEANRLRPNGSMIIRALGQSYLNANQLEPAIENLEKSVRLNPRSSFSWRQLAIALGRMDRMAESSLALAEEALLLRKYKDAIFLAGRAEKDLPVGSPKWIQAQDIRVNAERLEKKRRN